MTQYLGQFTYNEVSIANGQTSSGAIDLQGLGLLGIIMPSAFTGTTITFTASFNNVTFTALYNTSGSALSMTVAASRYICVDPADLVGIRYIKLVSGSAEGGARTIGLVTRELQ